MKTTEEILQEWREMYYTEKSRAEHLLTRIEKQQKIIDVVEANIGKLARLVRMPNVEWAADQHNNAIDQIKEVLRDE